MKDGSIRKTFKALIRRGMHVLIIEDDRLTTMQPITERGHDAIRRMLVDDQAPADFLAGISTKRHGHYAAAIPVVGAVEATRRLVEDYDLPPNSIGYSRFGGQIAPLRLGDKLQ